MAAIAGIGTYVPRYRIDAAEINGAWGRPGGRGRKAVAGFDEDVLTMGIEAARACEAQAASGNQNPELIAFASVSSGYSEFALAAQAAQVVDVKPSAGALDFGLTTRSATSALLAVDDAVNSKRIGQGLVIASDKLVAQPGSSYELTYGAGAGALLIAEQGIAQIEGFSSHSSGFVGLSRREGAFHGMVDDRFVMQHGYIEQAQSAIVQLQTSLKNSEWDHVALQAPDDRWTSRLMKVLKMAPEKLRSGAPQIGYVGCALFFINLALALEAAKPGERILAVSYGPGGCDAVAIRVLEEPKFSRLTSEKLAGGVPISYPQYLRMNKLLRGEA